MATTILSQSKNYFSEQQLRQQQQQLVAQQQQQQQQQQLQQQFQLQQQQLRQQLQHQPTQQEPHQESSEEDSYDEQKHADQSKSNEGKEKRKRHAAACDSCRRRKRKCDYGYPCSQCMKKGIACTFVMDRRRQTRKTMAIIDDAAAMGAKVAPHLTSAGASIQIGLGVEHYVKEASVDPKYLQHLTPQSYKATAPKSNPLIQMPPEENIPMGQSHTDFLAASHTAVMIDLFFEHFACVFGCIDKNNLLHPVLPSQEFLLHAVLAVVNRSFGDVASRERHEMEARRLANLSTHEYTEEAVQAFIALSFYYTSENITLAGHFARMAESTLLEAENKLGRNQGLMKLRGLCRSMRYSTDVNALLEAHLHIQSFDIHNVDPCDPCMVRRIGPAVLSELIRADGELVHTFFNSNPFRVWPSLSSLSVEKADVMVSATEYAIKELSEPRYSFLPLSSRWGIAITNLSMKAMSLWMSGRHDEAISTVTEAVLFQRPSASQFLSAKPMVVPFLACLAIIADAAKRVDLLSQICQLFFRLGRIFRTAWLGYNAVAKRLPEGSVLPAPVAQAPESTPSSTVAFSAGAGAAAGAVAAAIGAARSYREPLSTESSTSSASTFVAASEWSTTPPTPPQHQQHHQQKSPGLANHQGGSDVSAASTPLFLSDAGGADTEKEEDDLEVTIGKVIQTLPATDDEVECASKLLMGQASRGCDPWIVGMNSWDDQIPKDDWTDFWQLSHSLH